MWKLSLLALILCSCNLAQAQIMKCVDAKGNTTFSDGGCNSSTQRGSTVNIKPASGKDNYSYKSGSDYSNDDAYDRNAYSQNQYQNTNRNEQYRAAAINNQKQRKYSNDRQNALDYEYDIKRKNDERMNNMNNTNRSGSRSSNSSSSGNTCLYIRGQVRC